MGFPRPPRPGPAATLFASLLAAQSALLALSPVLGDVARAFAVSPAAAGQLRALSGAVAVAAALAVVAIARRPGPRGALLAGLGMLAAGALGAALAPSLAVLALAQAPTGAGLALVLSGGLAAAAEWAPPGGGARVLSWALLGQPAAWVAGMPLAGAAAEASWRLALALPAAPAIAAAVLVARRPAGSPAPSPAGTSVTALLRGPGVARWALGELLAYAAWCGTLVYAGWLLARGGASAGSVGVALAAAGAAYMPGNLLARRWPGRPRARVVAIAAASAPPVAALCASGWGLPAGTVLLCLLSALAGARTMAGSALGLSAGGALPVAAMGLRTAAVQGGYLLWAATGGAALALGGAPALAAALGGAFVLSAAVHGAPSGPLTAARRGRETRAPENPSAVPLAAAPAAGAAERRHRRGSPWHAPSAPPPSRGA